MRVLWLIVDVWCVDWRWVVSLMEVGAMVQVYSWGGVGVTREKQMAVLLGRVSALELSLLSPGDRGMVRGSATRLSSARVAVLPAARSARDAGQHDYPSPPRSLDPSATRSAARRRRLTSLERGR